MERLAMFRGSWIASVAAAILLALLLLPARAVAEELPPLQDGEVRIHVLPFDDTDAIVVECDGRFGVVDSAEDALSPDGSDARYPMRPGIIQGGGKETEVIAYMKSIGVTSDNLDFYIGTHPHSDHIGSALQIIHEFHPVSIYTPVYDDSFITDSARLWDNQFVYDRLVEAAQWAGGDEGYGARFIQHLDEACADSDDAAAEGVGSPRFTLGSAEIEIVNYDEGYQLTKVPDANYFSYGVKVTAANGRVAFLAGDINNYTDGDAAGVGDEDRLKLTLGQVDFLKMAHHGRTGSNTPDYLRTILKNAQGDDRSVVVQTGRYALMPWETVQVLNEKGAKHFNAASMRTWGHSAFVADLAANGVRTNNDGDQMMITQVRNASPYACLYYNGLPYEDTGWHEGTDGRQYFFGEPGVDAGSTTALTSRWATLNGMRTYVNAKGCVATGWEKIGSKWYLFNADGALLYGWQKVNGKWYYLESDGAMATGWKKVGSKWYYLDPANGDMKTGWQKVGGSLYYLDASGAMVSGNGWLKMNGTWYYATPSGAFKTGWLKDKGTWYYLRDSGAMATGWEKVKGTWYHMKSSGAMQTGWQKIGGTWYHLKGSGAMATGWEKVKGTWYHMKSSGAMQTGWQKIGGTWYHLKGSGAMTVGWLKDKGTWYYLRDSGAMATGTHVIDGVTYHFSSSGAMR
ncbi:MBL fold metallo-hydrolase [Adlercreutzia sp. R21]|nr:MBL fold metallo-hydrolase [Adlercreutzia sp. R21]